ncbi:aminotransferase class I/II-fold pyridoxal phosphate-dependent enzyme [Salicibibacter halophilus]|uniref:Aminotransferase class I/II-fold pyridoxal phosphate-dependent enzyme n=1 Tax=Salicibibacter halophilus TaxID=2502791 RepID=A0A514LMH3_9BACI|nr:aminotransferase class I/II-fold pyridoxal phosphate-dependent enzyme [Salicibibacter halophilus]
MIEDDVYRDLWLSQEAEPSLASMDDGDHILQVGSFSKTVAPNLRIGWIAGPEVVIQKLSDLRMQTDLRIKCFTANGDVRFYNFRKIRRAPCLLAQANSQTQRFYGSVGRSSFRDWAAWEIPEGGMFLWLTFSSDVNVKKLFTEALRRGVLINPGYIYSPYNNQNVLLSYVSSSFQEIEPGILILKEIITTMEDGAHLTE